MDARFRGHDDKGRAVGDDARIFMEKRPWA
jgi:hypothetical protein